MIEYLFPAYFVVGMFIAALNAKSLGAMILYGLGLLTVYPDVDKANFLLFFVLAVTILAAFRD
jgi:hypothetical protein